MTVLSIIPAVGSALIWIPAVIVLAISGQYIQATGLFLFCSLLVGSIDNALRPWLVGRDTPHELYDLLFHIWAHQLFSASWVSIVGPSCQAHFVTLWDIYAETLIDYLTESYSYINLR